MKALLLLLLLPSLGFAEAPLGDLPLLYKMSQAIRGVAPSSADKAALGAAQASGHVEEFFRAKAAEYLRSPNHAVKMSYRFSELFRVKVPREEPRENSLEDPVTELGAPAPPRDYSETSLGELFFRIAHENLSLDELATGRRYRVFSRGSSTGPGAIGDLGFFQRLANLPTDAPTGNLADTSAPGETTFHSRDVQFGPAEPQVAGAITTTRFFERYANSQTNHNRRRAAALYRIFLCDNMSPVVPGSASDDPEIVTLLYPDHGAASEAKLNAAAPSRESLHGKQPLCIGCHQKLDPVGSVFDTSPVVAGRTPSVGALVMVRPGKPNEVIPVTGFAELGRALVAQPEYKRCQVQRLWTWFIGQNIPLSATRRDQLVQQFDAVNHRTNDFVGYLVNQPEFRYRVRPTAESRLANRVFQTMRRCTECHQAARKYRGPDLSAWPLHTEKSDKTPADWLELVSRKISLAENGKNARMPPSDANWKLTDEDFDVLRKWMAAGAPDTLGKKQVAP